MSIHVCVCACICLVNKYTKKDYIYLYLSMHTYIHIYIYIAYAFSQDRAEKSCIGAQRCRTPVQGCVWQTRRGLVLLWQEAHVSLSRFVRARVNCPTAARIASSFLCMLQSQSTDLCCMTCQLLTSDQSKRWLSVLKPVQRQGALNTHVSPCHFTKFLVKR